ncbi:MAG: PAAR-like domain-containing protein [Defluviicoccus sp.]
MGNNVYANNNEVACKKGSGKSICAFPDVCMTPPENPATPPGVPVPYPNTGMDSDTTDGSKTVKINSAEVMLKNKSYFKKSIGDESGCAAKKGIVTSAHRGKVYFIAWSMDVKVESENVVRNFDMTTHNHGSGPNTPPQIFAARTAMANIPGCEGQKEKIESDTKCGKGGKTFKCPKRTAANKAKRKMAYAKKKYGDASDEHRKSIDAWNKEMDKMAAEVHADACQSAMRCLLSPYKPSKCCRGQTPHHLVEASSFYTKGREASDWTVNKKGQAIMPQRPIFGCGKYNQNKAPCICVEGENQHQATHGQMHAHQNQSMIDAPKVHHPMYPADEFRSLDNAQKAGVAAVQEIFPESDCDAGCLEAQLKNYHERQCDLAPGQPVRAVEA